MSIEARLEKIARDLNGSLIAYRRITADADDNRYAIAYNFGAGAWATAVVDTTWGDYLAGTSHGGPITAGNVGRALEREQADHADMRRRLAAALPLEDGETILWYRPADHGYELRVRTADGFEGMHDVYDLPAA